MYYYAGQVHLNVHLPSYQIYSGQGQPASSSGLGKDSHCWIVLQPSGLLTLHSCISSSSSVTSNNCPPSPLKRYLCKSFATLFGLLFALTSAIMSKLLTSSQLSGSRTPYANPSVVINA